MPENSTLPEGLDALIAALQIFRKYGNPKFPTICEHDTLYIAGLEPGDVSEEDKAMLDRLGFIADEGESVFLSYRFGSA